LQQSGIESGNLFDNLGSILLLIGAFLLFSAILIPLVYLSSQIKERALKYKKKMVWNGIIRIMTVSYINYASSVSAFVQIDILLADSTKWYLFPLAGALSASLAAYPILCAKVLWKKKNV